MSDDAATTRKVSQRPRRLWTRVMILVRRVHLYSGLFLLPWVFLFGVTGAMFNHQGLFPQARIQPVPSTALESTSLGELLSESQLADEVVAALQKQYPNQTIQRLADRPAEYTGDMLFETWANGERHVAHINPVSQTAYVASHPGDDHKPKPVLDNVKNISISPAPMQPAQSAATEVFKAAGVENTNNAKPIGWTKLNFLVSVDGQPARLTYVLKDGHVDVTTFDGNPGFSPRQFFLRLHTTHVMSPYWNGRTIWVIAADVLAAAMVVWGLSGIVMWWQIKRTRLIGAAVVAASIATAVWMYLSVGDFYARTLL